MIGDLIKNGKITHVSLSMADYACLVFNITIKGDYWGCGIGNYAIGHGYVGAKIWTANGNGLIAMMKIMDVVGVSKWEDLEGQYVRVEFDNPTGAAKIIKIGNIIDNKWFNIREFFAGDWGGKESKFDEIDPEEEDDELLDE